MGCFASRRGKGIGLTDKPGHVVPDFGKDLIPWPQLPTAEVHFSKPCIFYWFGFCKFGDVIGHDARPDEPGMEQMRGLKRRQRIGTLACVSFAFWREFYIRRAITNALVAIGDGRMANHDEPRSLVFGHWW